MTRSKMLAMVLVLVLLGGCGSQTPGASTAVEATPGSDGVTAEPGPITTAAAMGAETAAPATETSAGATTTATEIPVEATEIATGMAVETATSATEAATADAAAATAGPPATPKGQTPPIVVIETEQPAGGGWNCGDRSRLGPELHIFSWSDYIPEEDDNNLLREFEEACGVKVTLDTYPSNEDLAAKLRAGNTGYDLVLPSDYMVDILVQEGRLLKLEKSLLPNLKNMDPRQMGLYFDPNNDYSVPYQYGMTGIAFDSSKVQPAPDSWAALFDPAQLELYKNSTSMLDDERESVGAALRSLGYSYNSTDAEQLAQAKDVLLRQKPLLARYDSENVASALASGEIVLAHAWNGSASEARAENPNIQ